MPRPLSGNMHGLRSGVFAVGLSCACLFAGTAHSADAEAASGAEEAKPQPLDRVRIEGKFIRDPQLISYTKTYRALRQYESYPRSKDLLLPRLFLKPRKAHASLERVQVALIGDATYEAVPFDHGWGPVPDNKSAFDEGAEFLVNRPAGSFELKHVMTMRTSPDGHYSVGALRSACTQWMEFMRNTNFIRRIEYAGRQCVGVNFEFSGKGQGSVWTAGSELPGHHGVAGQGGKTVDGGTQRVRLYFATLDGDAALRTVGHVVVVLPVID